MVSYMIPIHIPEDLRRNLTEAFAAQRCCRLPRLPLSATAFIAWQMQRAFERSVVLVTDSLSTQDELHRNLATFAGTQSARLLYYPAREYPAPRKDHGQSDLLGERLQTLGRLQDLREPIMLVTCVQALMQAVPSAGTLRANLLRLELQQEY